MNIKSLLVIMIGVIIFLISSIKATAREDISWDLLIKASSLISNDSQDIMELFAKGKEDTNIREENSTFRKEALKIFDKENTYYDFLEDDTEIEEIPFAVFKTIMVGYGWMSYIDWKDISSSGNMILVLNNMFKTINMKKLSKVEIENIKNSVNPILSDYSFKKEVLATNTMIKTIGSIVKKRNYRVLWYIEASDSYSFFLVTPQVYEKLNGTQLGDVQEFKEPEF